MNDTLKIILFVLASAGIVYLSRRSLIKPRSHGFYRCFAFEFILALILLNLNAWFKLPFAWHQVLSWILLMTALVPLGFGVRSLVTRGKPARQRAGEPQLLGFENTTALVTSGIYAYIRHPLYSSLLLLAWGVFFKAPGWAGAGLAAAATLALVFTARADETECIEFFGEAYRAYMLRTKRFVPYVV
ncbi:isoprenylcysteine carboxylmethyltransferase family protein [bacterium]|nr:isoprenylcysteine carboxylmethyltransferase family protein [bacterium]